MTDANDEAQLTGAPRAKAPRAVAPVALVEEPVPRLPRGRGLRLSRIELMRIAGLTMLLVFLLATQRQCADAVSGFVTSFGDQGSASPKPPGSHPVHAPASPPGGSQTSAAPGPDPSTMPGAGPGSDLDLDRYEHLRPGMTEAEMKAVIERAKAKAVKHRTGSDAP